MGISVLLSIQWVTIDAIEDYEKLLKTAKEIGDRGGSVMKKEEPMRISVPLSIHWVTIKTPLSIMQNSWKLQKKSVIEPGREKPLEISVIPNRH